jgi:hypothetical protein
MVVISFPQGYLNVVASTSEHPAQQKRKWTPQALAKGLLLLREWLRRYEEANEGIKDDDLRKAIERLKK